MEVGWAVELALAAGAQPWWRAEVSGTRHRTSPPQGQRKRVTGYPRTPTILDLHTMPGRTPQDMPSRPKRHHFITRSYLDGFGKRSPSHRHHQVWVGTRDGRSFPSSTHNVAVRSGYFTLGSKETNPLALEDLFAKMESGVSDYLQRCRSTPSLPTPEERAWMAFFVVMHFLRVPARRDTVREFLRRTGETTYTMMAMVPGAMEDALVELGLATADNAASEAESLRSLKPGVDFDLEIADNSDLPMLVETMRDTFGIVADMRWAIATAPAGRRFITSDCPASFGGPLPGTGHLGIMDPNVLGVFPLNSRACLLLTWFMGETVREATHQEMDLLTAKIRESSREVLIGRLREDVTS